MENKCIFVNKKSGRECDRNVRSSENGIDFEYCSSHRYKEKDKYEKLEQIRNKQIEDIHPLKNNNILPDLIKLEETNDSIVCDDKNYITQYLESKEHSKLNCEEIAQEINKEIGDIVQSGKFSEEYIKSFSYSVLKGSFQGIEVASKIYQDYKDRQGQSVPNLQGLSEDLESMKIEYQQALYYIYLEHSSEIDEYLNPTVALCLMIFQTITQRYAINYYDLKKNDSST